MGTVLGLTEEQHGQMGRLIGDARPAVVPPVGVRRKPKAVRPLVRVMAPAGRSYDSRVTTDCVLFSYDTSRTIFTMEFVGSVLSGYLVLTIGTQTFTVECRRENLNDILAAVPALERATVLPGVWEFDFGAADRSTITVSAAAVGGQAEVDLCALLNQTTCAFNGSAVVREEAWFTRTDAAGVADVVPVSDGIPFADGAIGAGAIGTACWSWEAGYIVTGWQCREFSFAAGYDPATDIIDAVSGETGTGPGAGGGGLPSEEVPAL
jgi:hypothetical protein